MEAILVVAVGLFAVIAFANLFSWGVDCRREIRRRKRARSASGVFALGKRGATCVVASPKGGIRAGA